MTAFTSFFFLITVAKSAFPASGQDHMISSIFVLAGQSNMAGRGGVVNRTWDGYVPLDSQPSHSIFRLNPNLKWEPAQEPVDDGFDGDTCGVGPGMAFANDLIGHEDGHGLGAVGLVPFAVGGTKISQWARGSSLYDRMVQRASEAVKSGGTMRALLWYQGESDTVDLEDANKYGPRIAQFFMDVRSDLNESDLLIMQVSSRPRSSYFSIDDDNHD